MGRILEFITYSSRPKVWKPRPKITNLPVDRALTRTQAPWLLGMLKKISPLVFMVTFIPLFLGKSHWYGLFSPSIFRIRQYKAGKGIVYICYASEEWDTFNCMGTFFAHFLTLRWRSITICFLGVAAPAFVTGEVGWEEKANKGSCTWSAGIFCWISVRTMLWVGQRGSGAGPVFV